MPDVASLKVTCLSLWKPLAYQRGVKGLGQPVSWDVPGLTSPGGVHVCVRACARPGQPGWAPEEGWWELSIHHRLPLRLTVQCLGPSRPMACFCCYSFIVRSLNHIFFPPKANPSFTWNPS